MLSSWRKKSIDGFLLSVYFVSLFWLLQIRSEKDFPSLVAIFSISFFSFLVILMRFTSAKSILVVFCISAIVCSLSHPLLSVDYFRFLWDGSIQHLGINPYQYVPSTIASQNTPSSKVLIDQYIGMSDLSKGNFSCYPTVNQAYFYLASFFNSITTQLLALRVLIIGSELIGWWALQKILAHFQLKKSNASWLFLNPLFLIETIGNVHFEGVMISFLFLFIYYLLLEHRTKSSIALAFAVQTKLIPLLFLPFLLRFLGWAKTTIFVTLTLVLVIGLQLVYLNTSNYQNFISSLDLYFHEFEFNSLLLYPYLLYGKWLYAWNMTRIYAPKLARYFLLVCLSIAFYGGEIKSDRLIFRLTLTSSLYLVFTSTVHPWYWLLPLSLATLTQFKSVLVMSFLTFFSYGAYYFDTQTDFRMVLMIINLLWLVYFGLEVYFKSKKENYLDGFLSGTGS